MVGRLVEDEEVAAREEESGQLEPAALPTRQRAHATRQRLVVEPDAGRDAAGLGIRPVAAQHAEALLEAREASDGPVALHAVALLDPQSRRLQLLGQSGRLASAEQVVDRHLVRLFGPRLHVLPQPTEMGRQ